MRFPVVTSQNGASPSVLAGPNSALRRSRLGTNPVTRGAFILAPILVVLIALAALILPTQRAPLVTDVQTVTCVIPVSRTWLFGDSHAGLYSRPYPRIALATMTCKNLKPYVRFLDPKQIDTLIVFAGTNDWLIEHLKPEGVRTNMADLEAAIREQLPDATIIMVDPYKIKAMPEEFHIDKLHLTTEGYDKILAELGVCNHSFQNP